MRNFKKHIVTALALLGLAVAAPASAVGTKTVEVMSTGYGASKEEATRNGLSQAVAQVNGTSLRSSQAVSSSSVSGMVANSNGETESINMELTSSISANTETSGFIHSYEVLSMVPQDRGFEAKLKVKVYRYDAPVSSKRQRIAVLPVKHARGYQLFTYKNGSSVAKQLGKAIENHLVQSRKFAVLSRQELDAIQDELALIRSDLTSREEKAKTGRLLGADFIMIPEITRAYGEVETKTIQVTGQKKTTINGSIALSIKVIAAATGEIKFSEQYLSRTSKDDSSALITSVAKKAIDDTVDRIYPKLIVLAEGDRVGINAGGRSVTNGQHFKVFAKGENVFDPYTGESLGSDETYVATIKVTKVLSKMAYAKVVSGGNVQKGMVVRPTKPTKSAKKKMAEPEPSKPVSGIRLPFDN